MYPLLALLQSWDVLSYPSFPQNSQPEIVLFSVAFFCKDPCVQNIQGVKQGFAVGAENDSELVVHSHLDCR